MQRSAGPLLDEKGMSTYELMRHLDADGDGELSRNELSLGMRSHGVHLKEQELDALIEGFQQA